MTAFVLICWLHFLGDFILQTDRMAQNKSKLSGWLALHVGVYSTCFVFFGWKFVLATWLAHFATDYVTSRITSKLWQKNERHWFFVVIGADQALHLTQLALCYEWLVKT